MAPSFRFGIAYRTALLVIGAALMVGIVVSLVVGAWTQKRAQHDMEVRLTGLLDTVTNTASAACFVGDPVLAADIAAGLLKNSVVQSVVIQGRQGELTRQVRAGEETVGDLPATPIRRAVPSPFDARQTVGEIIIEPNLAELRRIGNERVRFVATALAVQMIILALVALLAVLRWVIRPITTLSNELHALRADGHARTLPVPRGHARSEIGSLVADINDLAGHLQAARAEAEKASRAKGDFLANMSHEIRTPINAVAGMAYLALQTDLNPRQADYLEKIRASAGHLLNLLNDVLDVAKIEAGKMNFNPVPFDLPVMLDRLSAINGLRAEEKGLAFHVEIAPEVPRRLVGDYLKIQQVLLNYVSNAIKFTRYGHVTLRAQLRGMRDGVHLIRFSVADSGIGLNPSEVSRLFQPFEQANADTAREYGGTGLGLVICRKLVELHGGTVGVESTPDVGSLFWAELPLPVAPADSVPLNVDNDLSPTRLSATLYGRRILIAEDNLFNQQITRELLERYGAVVSVANSGEEALKRIGQSEFDCVLMDMRMPEMDGLEATRRIRLDGDYNDLPIIAMTANARTEDRDACLIAGMNDFLAKPFEPQQLYKRIIRWIDPEALARWQAQAVEDVDPPPAAKAPPALPAQDEVDFSILDGLTGGDPGNTRSYLALFQRSTDESLARLAAAVAAGDLRSVDAVAHQIKSSTRMVGAYRLGDLCESLERAAEGDDAESVGRLHEAVTACWKQVERALAARVRALDVIPDDAA